MREIMVTLVGFFLLFASPAQANNHNPTNSKTVVEQDTLSLPKVFQLGDHETLYEKISIDYQESLLTASDDDFTLCTERWSSMLKELEAHAEMVNYDLKGVKMWLNVFFEENGKISHIAFFLKPASKNVDRVELGAFLMDFMNSYHFPVTHKEKYSYYSGAAFPTIAWKKKTN